MRNKRKKLSDYELIMYQHGCKVLKQAGTGNEIKKAFSEYMRSK